MTIITLPALHPAHPHLRRFNPLRDLNPVADLIEACFDDTLDGDGRRFIQQMRMAARSPRFIRWAASKADYLGGALSGFVWEQDGKIVGNLSLIPMGGQRKVNLIANVAVKSDYRRQGIARQLTAAALDHIERSGGQEAWLHVREENDGAVSLYTKMGFVEQTRRTSWVSAAPAESIKEGVNQIIAPRREHWRFQRSWLAEYYPEAYRWYFSLDEKAFRPTFFAAVYRLFSEYRIKQWGVVSPEQVLLGVVSWQQTFSSADRLWVAANPNHVDSVIETVVPYVQKKVSRFRPLMVELPAGTAVESLRKIGFDKKQTLVWMKYFPR